MGDGVGKVIIVAVRVYPFVIAGQCHQVEVVRRAMNDAVVFVKSPLRGRVVLTFRNPRYVLLARHHCVIPRRLQYLRDGDAFTVQITAIARERLRIIHHVAHAGLV